MRKLPARSCRLLRRRIARGLAVALLTPALAAAQTTHTVGTEAALRTAITTASAGDAIVLTADITLTAGDLPSLATSLTIDGNGHTLSGNDQYRGLVVAGISGAAPPYSTGPITVAIQDLTIQDTVATGGAGGVGYAGGGGGAGLGGALFVGDQATVSVSNVSLVSSAAIGGHGGAGGAATPNGGGGGGLGGNGGAAGVVGGGGGGGVGWGADGGSAAAGTAGILTGIPGGGGGGAVGVIAPGSAGGAQLAAGNFGGGGGGAFGSAGSATDGGIGGGGGGGEQMGATSAYAGGGGGSLSGVGAPAGWFGGDGDGVTGGGGGGAGLGGAVFVQGGTLQVVGAFTVNGGTVRGGTGATGAGDGSAFGSGVFIYGDTTVSFAPSASQTVTIADDIADEAGSQQPLGGLGTIAMNGTGTLVLGGHNTYAGGTHLNAGTLVVSSDGNLGATSGDLVVGDAATLRIAASGTFSRVFSMGGGVQTIDVTPGQTATWSGRLREAGATPASLQVTGGGTLVLTDPTNDYRGALVNGGSTLVVASDGALGATGSAPVSLGDSSSGGTLGISAPAFTSSRAMTLGAGGGTIDTIGATSATLNGPVAGTGGLSKTGAGTLTLGGANTYAGGTSVSTGVLRAGSRTAFGQSRTLTIGDAALVDLNGFDQAFFTIAGPGTIGLTGGATLTVGGDGSSATFGGTLAGTGGLVKDGGGTLTLTGANTFDGGLTLGAGTLRVSSDANLGGAGALTMSDQTTLDIVGSGAYAHTLLVGGTPSINVGAGQAVTWSGPIGDSGGPGTLRLTGGGTVSLTNAGNSHSGGTIVADGGTLGVGTDGALGAPAAPLTLGDATSAATLAIDASGAFVSSRPIALGASGATFDVAGGTAALFGGVISGAGGLTKTGGGSLALAGANTYTGGTVIAGGALVGTAASLQGAVTAYGDVVFDQAADGTFQGVIAGSGGVTKIGAGTLRLGGANTYTGLTAVREGTLAIDGGLPGGVLVSPGATLRGAGRIGGSLNVAGTLIVPPASEPAAFDAGHAGLRALAASETSSLFVGGDLAATPGSTFELSVTPGGAAPLVIDGRADLVGTHLAVDIDDPAPPRVATYLALSAAGGVNASRLDVSSPTSTLVPVVNAYESALMLTLLNYDVPLGGVATSPAAISAGHGLDQVKRHATGDLGAVIREVTAVDDARVDAALRSLAGEIHASGLRLAAFDSRTVTDMVRDVLSDHERDSEGDPTYQARRLAPRFWFELAGGRSSFDSGAYGRGTADVGGGAGGLDFRPAANWTVGGGAALSLGQLSLSEVGGSSKLTAPRAFGYTGIGLGRFDLHFGGSAARAKTRTERAIAFAALVPDENGQLVPLSDGIDRDAESDQSGITRDAWTEWQDTNDFDSWTLKTKLGFRAARYTREAFTERGAGEISLAGAAQELKIRETHIDVYFFRRTGGWRPAFRAVYRREMGDESTEADVNLAGDPGSRFTVPGLPVPVNTFQGLVGLTLHTASGLEYIAQYRMQLAKGESHHSIGFRMRFR